MAALINDVHIHLGSESSINKTLLPEDILHHKEMNGVMSILVIPTHEEPEIEKLQKFLDRDIFGLYGLQWVTEHTTPSNLELDDKIIGCKFHGTYSNHSHPSVAVLEELNKLGAILMFHTGRYKDGNVISRTSYIHALTIAKAFPKISIIMAHMGGTDTTICKAAIDASKLQENIYFDTSGITTPYIIEYAVKSTGFTANNVWFRYSMVFIQRYVPYSIRSQNIRTR